MSLSAWLAFCVLESALCLIPGPAVLFVISTALTRGARSGLAAALGILAGNTCYFVLSATGVAALLVASPRLFQLLQWLGAVYLLWMGIRMLLNRSGNTAPAGTSSPAAGALLRGMVVQLTNPKAILFFVALLPQFIDPHTPVAMQILILGISSTVIEWLVLTMYVLLTVRARSLAGDGWTVWVQRVGGACLLTAGLRMAWLGLHAG